MLPALATDHPPPVSIVRRSNGVRSFLPLRPFQLFTMLPGVVVELEGLLMWLATVTAQILKQNADAKAVPKPN